MFIRFRASAPLVYHDYNTPNPDGRTKATMATDDPPVAAAVHIALLRSIPIALKEPITTQYHRVPQTTRNSENQRLIVAK